MQKAQPRVLQHTANVDLIIIIIAIIPTGTFSFISLQCANKIALFLNKQVCRWAVQALTGVFVRLWATDQEIQSQLTQCEKKVQREGGGRIDGEQ